MPEGHTIHRLAREHTRRLRGDVLEVTSPQGRIADGAARVSGRRLVEVSAYGKHLFYAFDGADIVHVHLGLFGKFFTYAPPPPDPRSTVRLRMSAERWTVDLIGAPCCEVVAPDEAAAVVARLGPDPLRRDADPDRAWARLHRRSTPIGHALMDQSVVAGVGNVYRAEALFVHGIHPERPARDLSPDQWSELWSTLVNMLRRGVADGVIITVDPAEIGKPRNRIAKGEALWVYKQDRCRRCRTPVRRWDLGGRWAYACERCQPR